MKYDLKTVFTPGGQPSITYVDREHLGLEKKVIGAIKQGYALNVITGPTKSGKTVLCKAVLRRLNQSFVSLEGGQIRAESDFWNQLADGLNLPRTIVVGQVDGESERALFGASVGVASLLGAKGERDKSVSTQQNQQKTFEKNRIVECIKFAEQNKIAIIVDDFHYMDRDIQKSIIQAIKSAIFGDLVVIFIAVPHRAFDPITVEHEMEGRFRHIEIPVWSDEDLIKIPTLGFSALNVSVSATAVKEICASSFGNPLLVQEICSGICAESEIYETQDSSTVIPESNLIPTFRNVAASKGFPKFNKLKNGPQARKKRQQRDLKSGGNADIYVAVMMALASLVDKTSISYDDIRSELRNIICDGQVPQKHEVTSALSHISKIAAREEGEPVLDWIKTEDRLVITDPFMRFYMKWQATDAQ